MQPANSATVLGGFDGARFTKAGVVTRFSRRDGSLWARTDGPDGVLHDYQITYTFGVAPLQQYLVAFPGGRSQALEIAWDSRPAGAGGQRWFHLYPRETITSQDPLHWTGATENWNFMCADCHSTNVRKRFDPQTGTYATSFAEVSVSCEACHGPGSLHVAWASQPAAARGAGDKGLAIALDERNAVSWTRDPVTGKPHRSRPRQSEREIDMCARCHARRGLIHEDDVHGQSVGDDYRVALLDDDLYYPDGQIKGEVYEYGSFIQSRMFAAGVTCSDCHDPHRPAVAAWGDNVCLRCHASETYFTSRHHFHPQASAGARCVACHMPARTYMVVDPRRDHSLRVPRPDLSVKLGVPNPCNGCHADRSATWAAETVDRWYGHAPVGLQRFAETLAAGAKGAPGAPQLLAALAVDPGQPAIARATALSRLQRGVTGSALAAARTAASDPSPLVRRAAARVLADVDPADRAPLLAPLLADAVRSVRIEAVPGMAGLPSEALSPADRGAFERATGEFVAAQELNGDRPESHLNLANLAIQQRRFDAAEAELRSALAIDPAFAPAAVNLGDLFRMLGRDGEAEPVLRAALAHAPSNPAVLHALGLVMVRQKRARESLVWLAAAARLGADNPRYGYVYAVALHDAGQRRESERAIDDVLRRWPYDRDALSAQVVFHRDRGDLPGARRYLQRLQALEPPEAAAETAAAEPAR
jgi:tetratricopeptide (TPR) repeat protein